MWLLRYEIRCEPVFTRLINFTNISEEFLIEMVETSKINPIINVLQLKAHRGII